MVLNEEQRYAVQFSGKHLLVLAGAGTGKTMTIIERAKHLIKSGVLAHRIIILSFTRKSAKEIVSRIRSDIEISNSEGLQGQTFHSWCMGIIKNNPNAFKFHNYTVMDEEDRDSCFKLICGRTYKDSEGKKVTPGQIAGAYSYAINAKCNLSTAMRVTVYDNAPDDEYFQGRIKDLKPIFSDVIQNYIIYKNAHKYLDYDDILLLVANALKKNEELRKSIASLYDHILVDEMQDTNPLQYDLLSSFYDRCHLFCVGDDAQSIYGFRGADFKTIHNFTEIIPESEVCKLTLNYRSTQELLDLSNWLLRQSLLKYDKELKSFRGKGDMPQLLDWDYSWQEAEDITDKMLESRRVKGYNFKDNMCLSRTSFGLREVEAKCIKKKIPYIIYGGTSLMQSKHIRDVISPMRIVSNHRDELAWLRYLKLWKGIGDVTASKIIDNVIMEENLGDCVLKLMDMNLQDEISSTLVNLSDMQSNPSGAIKKALETMSGRLSEIYKDSWLWRSKDFNLLEDVALSTGSISEFIAEYVLDPRLDTTIKNGGADEDKVILTTIHSAKGLEAAICYIVNASPRSYPTSRAILNGEDAIEEERRCLYVAMTRAKDELYIYRDIHSVHIYADADCIREANEKYFLQHLPDNLVEEKVIGIVDTIKVDYTGEVMDYESTIPDFDYE